MSRESTNIKYQNTTPLVIDTPNNEDYVNLGSQKLSTHRQGRNLISPIELASI